VEHDGRGNAVLVRTRANDSEDMTLDATLELLEEDYAAAPVRPFAAALPGAMRARTMTVLKGNKS
jgi:hypothetical protein